MTSHAFIKLVPASNKSGMSLEELEELLAYYIEITSKTGQQLDWSYEKSAFPYTYERVDNYLTLTSSLAEYNKIYLAVGDIEEENEEIPLIQVSLPITATHGDKGKANELCKFLAKKLKGELQLFNGRVMYFYKR
ncbi:DUF1885 family protein [Metabacillus herbersteinensis]|uniref:DUF1885 family protein n=1 Tax=Metabacillus herbersteinensis TaxID=283816 RepID=A0ABV6GLU5_9BACI